MDVSQDWGNVWPGPRSFHPSTVPLPIRQGFQEKAKAPPHKFANSELMKIPNFLHLTPPVIKRQCNALKQFCTPWPKGLTTEESCEKHFPIQYISSEYVHGLPTIRNLLTRIVSVRVRENLLLCIMFHVYYHFTYYIIIVSYHFSVISSSNYLYCHWTNMLVTNFYV